MYYRRKKRYGIACFFFLALKMRKKIPLNAKSFSKIGRYDQDKNIHFRRLTTFGPGITIIH